MPDIDMSEPRYPYVVLKGTPERLRIANYWRTLHRMNPAMARLMWKQSNGVAERIVDAMLHGETSTVATMLDEMDALYD